MLCWEFFKTGLFAMGGGLATLPFLTRMGQTHPDWFTASQLTDMIAVSEATPGPLGVNMSTYVGYTVAGIPGALLATLSLVLPSLTIITLIAAFFSKFSENKYVRRVFYGVRPASVGLIAAAGYSVVKTTLLTGTAFAGLASLASFVNVKAAVIFAVIFALRQIKKARQLHPIIFIMAGAAVGILIKL